MSSLCVISRTLNVYSQLLLLECYTYRPRATFCLTEFVQQKKSHLEPNLSEYELVCRIRIRIKLGSGFDSSSYHSFKVK